MTTHRTPPDLESHNMTAEKPHPDREMPVGEWRPSLLLALPAMIGTLAGWAIITFLLSLTPEWAVWLSSAGALVLGDASPSVPVWQIIGHTLVVLLIFPPVIRVIARIMTTRYVVTTQRLHYYRGIINRYQDQIEIVRIRDLSVVKPLTLRVFGHGHVVLHTEDRTHNLLEMVGVNDPSAIKDTLHSLSLGERARLGYREFETT